MAPACLHALPTLSGHAPNESADGALVNLEIQSWIRATVSSWTLWGGTWLHRMHWHIMSHRRSVGFRSGERDGQSVASIPLSDSIILDLSTCPGPVRPGNALHQEELWAYSVWSDNCSEDFITVPHSTQGTIGHDMEVYVAFQRCASPDHHWPTNKPVMLDNVTDTPVACRRTFFRALAVLSK